MGAAELSAIREEIRTDPENATARAAGYEPLYVAEPAARIAVIGQAPGRKAQESGIAWGDASGVRLREWLGVDEPTFRDPDLFALLPMDFYFPGKGVHGDLPPRRGFAERWHPRILAQLPHVEFTLLIGSYAQRHYLETRDNLTTTVQRFRDFLPDRMPLVHPSPLNFRWLARNPWFETDLLPVLRRRVTETLGSG
ncbi:MAG: uracil-DNA glycosylase family protein [Nocardioides sp.]|uniref:uracil-DNA glycosylase family protein n=1 Tax=Nocardioides sp. TaxID=35761 RepID=UPI0039E4A933